MIKVSPLPPSLAEDAFALAESELGRGQHDRMTYLNTSISPLCVLDGDQLLACAVVRFDSRVDFLQRVPSMKKLPILDKSAPGPLGIIESIAVTPAARGQGLATALIQSALDLLRSRDHRSVIMLGWEPDTGLTLGSIPGRLGFTSIARCSFYRNERSRTIYSHCPSCGQPPCHCHIQVLHQYLPEASS